MPRCPAPSHSLPHPVAAHQARCRPAPSVSHSRAESPAPRRSGADAGNRAVPQCIQGLLSLSHFPLHASMNPTPLLFPSPPHAPEHLQKPPTALPFQFIFLLHPLHAPLPPSSPPSLSVLSLGCLSTRSPSHPWRQVSASSVSRSSVHHGSQVACASPSPFGTVGPRHRRHP
jgi:hypothetical protein